LDEEKEVFVLESVGEVEFVIASEDEIDTVVCDGRIDGGGTIDGFEVVIHVLFFDAHGVGQLAKEGRVHFY
jgi:hypothetical protein